VPGNNPCVSPLETHKRLLIAESELHRARLFEDWQAIAGGARALTARVQSISLIASTTALLVAAVSAFRRGRALPNRAKSSWLQTALKGAQLASSIWLAFRARSR